MSAGYNNYILIYIYFFFLKGFLSGENHNYIGTHGVTVSCVSEIPNYGCESVLFRFFSPKTENNNNNGKLLGKTITLCLHNEMWVHPLVPEHHYTTYAGKIYIYTCNTVIRNGNVIFKLL